MPLWHGSIYIQERMRTIYNFTSVFGGGFLLLPGGGGGGARVSPPPPPGGAAPPGAAGVYVSPDVSIDNAANTLRFKCESNWTGGSFFVWSEFSLFILSE